MTELLNFHPLPNKLVDLAHTMFEQVDPFDLGSSKYHLSLRAELGQSKLATFVNKYQHTPLNSGYLPYRPEFELFKQYFQQWFEQPISVDFQLCNIIDSNLIGPVNVPLLRSSMCKCDPVVIYSLTSLKFNIYQPNSNESLNEYGMGDNKELLTLVDQIDINKDHYWPVDIGNFIIEEIAIPSYKILINFPKEYPFYHLNNYY